MKKFLRGLLAACAAACALSAPAAINNYQPNYQLINNPDYPTLDLGVATVNVLDYGIDNTGNRDCTADVQELLDKVGGTNTYGGRGDYRNIKGGIVYLPAGTYRFDGTLVLPVGVTIRGDWKSPGNGAAASGTIIKINPPTWTLDEDKAFITMQPCTEVNNLTFWYPEQSATNVRQAPPTVLTGMRGDQFWGNEYCTVRHCTFINSYIGVMFNSQGGGGCPNVFDVYGTPLSHGVIMDNIADIGRFDGLHFSPSYWEMSGLQGAPAGGEVRNWLYDNAVGISMRRNDWSYTCNLFVDGYSVGYLGEESPVEPSCCPNGHHYNYDLRNCKSGVKLTKVSYPGIMFTKIRTSGCERGFDIHHSGSGPVQLYGCELNDRMAIYVDENSSSQIMVQECDVKGAVNVNNGHFQAVNNSFNSDVFIAPIARTIFRGNSFSGAKLDNRSLFECQVSDDRIDCRPLPDFQQSWMGEQKARPSRSALYVVSGLTPMYIGQDPASGTDYTNAIQNKLNEAGTAGGGVVYLPAGHYRLDGTLRIPKGVELKGASDLPNVPHGQGTILESFWGHNNANATPFISMEEGSGIRGIVINYPNQKSSTNPTPYPYSIRGNKDCYIVNVSIRASWQGIDLFTNKCDNHYVEYLGGHAFYNVIRVGGGSSNGIINNTQFNTIAYACGEETKFGHWPNSPLGDDKGAAYSQNMRELDFFIIGDCDGEIMYNNFLYGCNKGMHFVSDGNGGASNVYSVGNAVDGAVNTFVIEGIKTDLDLVNSQVVALNSLENQGRDYEAYFLTVGPNVGNRQVTLFSSDHWGSGNYFCKAESGTVNLYNAHADESGRLSTFNISGSAKVNVVNSIMDRPYNFTAAPGQTERQLYAYASMLDPTNAQQGAMAAWQHILPSAWTFTADDIFLSRDGWTVSAHNDVNGSGTSRRVIDGDPATRWDTAGSQTAGQWFAVNFNKNLTINTIVFDSAASPSDGPAGYTVEVWYNNAWHQVAQGGDAGSILVVTFPEVTASQIRINQTGAKSNYWSIHEINVALADMEAPDQPEDPVVSGFDLEPSHILWSPGSAEINAGTPMSGFKVRVANRTNTDLPADKLVSVSLRISGQTVGSATFSDGIQGESYVDIDIPGVYVPAAGAHTVEAVIANISGEGNEYPNTRTRTFNAIGESAGTELPNFYETGFSTDKVNYRSLVLTKVTWTNANNGSAVIRPGDPVRFTATLYNNGNETTPFIKHGFLLETLPSFDPKYWSDNFTTVHPGGGIAPGETVELTTCGGSVNAQGIWTATAGTTYFRAWIDNAQTTDQYNLNIPQAPVRIENLAVEIANAPAPIEYHQNPTGDDSDQITGIGSVEASDNQPVIWYTIQGIRVAEPTVPGIYIRNGRKVLVK